MARNRGRSGGGGGLGGGGGGGVPAGGAEGGGYGGGRGGGFGGGGGRGRGRIPAGMRPVTEEQRIDIAVQLREFQARASRASRSQKQSHADGAVACTQASADKSITFPPGLSNDDRAVVHAECRKARPALAPRRTPRLRDSLAACDAR